MKKRYEENVCVWNKESCVYTDYSDKGIDRERKRKREREIMKLILNLIWMIVNKVK